MCLCPNWARTSPKTRSPPVPERVWTPAILFSLRGTQSSPDLQAEGIGREIILILEEDNFGKRSCDVKRKHRGFLTVYKSQCKVDKVWTSSLDCKIHFNMP